SPRYHTGDQNSLELLLINSMELDLRHPFTLGIPTASMTVWGLCRVKTALAMSPLAVGPSGVSGHDRGDQRLDPDDVHYPGQIIGENREGHLRSPLLKPF